MLSRLYCSVFGCDIVLQRDKSHVYGRCIRCGKTTPGWTYGEPATKVKGSQSYWDEVYKEFMDTELTLHGGG